MHIFKFQYFTFLLLLLHATLTANSIIIDNQTSDISILKNSQLYIDKYAQKGITEVSNEPNLFSPIEQDHLNFGYKLKEPVWIKFTVVNSSNESINKKLVYNNVNTNIVNLYTMNESNFDIIYNGSQNRKQFDKRLFFTFNIDLKAKEKKTYYLELKSMTHSLYFKLFIQNEKILIDSELKNQLVQALFFGGMLVILIYNAILYVFSRNSIYAYYVAMVFILTLHHLSLRGMISYISPHSLSEFQSNMPVYYTSLAVISVLLFARKFLNLHKYKLINLIIYLFFLILVAIMLFNSRDNYLLEFASHMAIVMSISLEFIAIYLLVTKKEKYAKYFVGVWTITLSGFTGTALYHAGIINLPTSHLFEATLMAEALLFSIILASQMNELKNEKLQLSLELLEQNNREHQKDKIIQEQNKLVSMGEMLGEISHQWRQPLSEINAVVLNLDTDFNQKNLTRETLNKNLEHIEEVIEHMSQTIEDFNSYYKKNTQKVYITLEEIVYKAQNLLASSMKSHNIQIDVEINEHSKVHAYTGKLIQVLIAIITNAKDALIENKVEAKKIYICVKMEKNRHTITIEDNAGGIRVENIEKIFEPYFTTKFKGKGVGIGLYMSKKIIEEEANAQLSVENTLRGARFKIIL